MIGMSDSSLSASVTEASRHAPYDRPFRQVLATYSSALLRSAPDYPTRATNPHDANHHGFGPLHDCRIGVFAQQIGRKKRRCQDVAQIILQRRIHRKSL